MYMTLISIIIPTQWKSGFYLANYIKESELPDESKFNILRQILHTIISSSINEEFLHRDHKPY